jgi:hypothetical protein
VGEPNVQRLPLFTDATLTKQDLYCNVDLLVLRENEVRVVLEVDETGYSPTKICGKFLATALCKRFRHPRLAPEPVPLSVRTLFVQIIPCPDKSLPRSRKSAQVLSLERSIRAVLPIHGSTVSEYLLLSGNTNDFRVERAPGQELIEHVRNALGQRT